MVALKLLYLELWVWYALSHDVISLTAHPPYALWLNNIDFERAKPRSYVTLPPKIDFEIVFSHLMGPLGPCFARLTSCCRCRLHYALTSTPPHPIVAFYTRHIHLVLHLAAAG